MDSPICIGQAREGGDKSKHVSSVLSCCSNALKRQTSVTAQSLIRQTEDSKLSRSEGGLTADERPQSILASSFYTLLFHVVEPRESQRKGQSVQKKKKKRITKQRNRGLAKMELIHLGQKLECVAAG